MRQNYTRFFWEKEGLGERGECVGELAEWDKNVVEQNCLLLIRYVCLILKKMDDLAEHIQKYIAPSEADLQAILNRFKKRTLKKGRHLLKSGQTSQEFMFIGAGCLRVFAENETGEITGWFAFEGEFFCELSSFLSQIPSKFSVQALEDTSLYYLTRADLEQLYRDLPVWQELMRKFWEQIIMHMVAHIVSFQTETAEARYQRALQHPQLMQRVPLKHLASYLGVTPTSLSRLRKRK